MIRGTMLNKGDPNQARALLGRSNFNISNMGTDGPINRPTNQQTDRRMKRVIEALSSHLKRILLIISN
jgi:hypothetical protein